MSMLTVMRVVRPTTAGQAMWAAGTSTNCVALNARKLGSNWAELGLTCKSGHPETSRNRRLTRNAPYCEAKDG
jgi:hypothetical protein